MLDTLKDRIVPGGRFFVQVNNCGQNPFDLVIADHLCHFVPLSLSHMAARASCKVEACRADRIHKEISLLAGVVPQSSKSDHDDPRQAIGKIESNVASLKGMLDNAREATGKGKFGIVGTSVAATRLASGRGNAVKFFVDEDPAREGHLHLGRPIPRPEQVPPGRWCTSHSYVKCRPRSAAERAARRSYALS